MIASSISGGGSSSSGGGGGIGGSTGSADNAIIRADGTGGSTLQSSGVLIADDNSIAGFLSGRKSGAGGLTLVGSDSGRTVSITFGGGDDDVTLPAAPVLGTFYRFSIISTDRLTIHVQGSHLISTGTLTSSAGGTITSNVKGSFLVLEYVATNLWSGLISGTWTVT